MKRPIIASLVAASLAFTPLAAPQAQAADAEDILGLVIGLGAIAIIADQVKDNKKKTSSKSNHYYQPRYGASNRYYDDRWDRWDDRRRYKGKRARKTVPLNCLRTFSTRRGELRAFGERCLERNMRNVRRLPNECERRVRTRRGPRDVYLPRCLRREGWKIEARNRGN